MLNAFQDKIEHELLDDATAMDHLEVAAPEQVYEQYQEHIDEIR